MRDKVLPDMAVAMVLSLYCARRGLIKRKAPVSCGRFLTIEDRATFLMAMGEVRWVFLCEGFFGKQIRLRGCVGGGILRDMGTKVLVSVAVSAVVGLYWARPDLMVLLLIVMGLGVYGWRHPDLDDWRGH